MSGSAITSRNRWNVHGHAAGGTKSGGETDQAWSGHSVDNRRTGNT